MSVASESITQSAGYPLCEACPDMGTDLLGMIIAVDWDIQPQTIQKLSHTRLHA